VKIAVLLFNLGGPAGLEDVPFFLFRFFKDPALLRLPLAPRVALAAFLALWRTKAARKNYALIGGKSPLLQSAQRQAKALEEALRNEENEYRVFTGMRHAKPFLRDTAREIELYDPAKIVLLPLFPQYTVVTTESGFREFDRHWKRKDIPVARVKSYPDQKGLIESFGKKMRALQKQAGSKIRVLFSAHGLPLKIIESGDPYLEECRKTVRALEAFVTSGNESVLCFQSRVGLQKWIGPSLLEEIARAGKEKKAVLVVPISFVSENVETIVEIQKEARAFAQKSGVPQFYVCPTPEADPDFINGLAEEVKIHGKL
jgi:ferrochelatase